MKFNSNLETNLKEQIKEIIYKATSTECKLNNISPEKYISVNVNKKLDLRIESIYIIDNNSNIAYDRDIYNFISLSSDYTKDIKSVNIKELMNLVYNVIKEFKD